MGMENLTENLLHCLHSNFAFFLSALFIQEPEVLILLFTIPFVIHKEFSKNSIALASSLFLDYAILKKKYHIVIYDNKDKITIILLLIFFLIPGFLKWNPVLLLLPIIYYVVICKLLYNLRISDFLSLSNLTRKQ